MKKTCFLFYVLIFITNVYSNPTIKVGTTLSNFQNIDDRLVTGLTAGLGWDWDLFKYTSFGFDIMYSEYGGNLEDIKVLNANLYPDATLYSYDLSVYVGYLLLPLNASINLSLNTNMTLKFGIGKTLPIAVADMSRLSNKVKLCDVDINSEEFAEIVKQVDSYWNAENSLGPQQIKLSDNHFFIKIQYSKYSFEIKYQHDGQFIKRVLSLTEIYEKSNSVSFILGIEL